MAPPKRGGSRLKGVQGRKLLTAMINLHVRYAEDEYVPAMRMYLMHKPTFIALFLFVDFLLVILLTFLAQEDFFDITWFVVSLMGSFLGLVILFFIALPHQRFQHSYTVDEHEFLIGEEGIIYETEYEKGALPWRRCTKLLEGEGFYLFEHDHRRITALPQKSNPTNGSWWMIQVQPTEK